jgi:hypothetical protein
VSWPDISMLKKLGIDEDSSVPLVSKARRRRTAQRCQLARSTHCTEKRPAMAASLL